MATIERCWTAQQSGVCRWCLLPEFAHSGQFKCCPDRQRKQLVRAELRAWFAIVGPARDEFHRIKKDCSFVRARFKQGRQNIEELGAAEAAKGKAMAQYIAAIEQANREVSTV